MPAQPPFQPGASFNTSLPPLDEFAFRQWVAQNRVPFNPDAGASDYDMRGFWRAQQQQNPQAASSVNANDGQMHYPDYWKTPQHETFSNQSQWASENDPQWINQETQLATPGGRVLFDERRKRDPDPDRQRLIDALSGRGQPR